MAQTDNEKMEQTRHLGRPGERQFAPKRGATGTLEGAPPRRLRFTMADMSAVFDVPFKSNLTVGRKASPNDKQEIDIDLGPYNAHSMGVSRIHAMIHTTSTRVMVKDFNSTNGTFLNGFALQPMMDYRLRDGDEITFGRITMKVQFLEMSPADTWLV